MEADPVPDEALEVLSVGRVEAHADQRGADALLLLPGGEVGRHEVLRLLGGCPLGEVDEVDGGPPCLHQLLDGLVERRLAVLELQGHRSRRASDLGHLLPVRAVSPSAMEETSPRVADMSRKVSARAERSGTCQAIPRSRSP